MERDGRSNERVRFYFGTPILSVEWPDAEEVNRQLAELILELERSAPSANQSNRGGWQSEKSLHELSHPAMRELLSWIDISVYLASSHLVGEEEVDRFPGKWRVSAWANVNRTGHFNGLHYHRGGFWSGVYYVAPAAEDVGDGTGAIVFHSPNQAGIIAANTKAPAALQQAFRQEIGMQPRAGLMLIFPSWLEHSVNPHSGTRPRISIAFDVAF